MTVPPWAYPTHEVAFLPSHACALQSFAGKSSQGARAPWGLPTTAEQVPTEPPTSQASHCPSHARSQQTPSLHAPLPHSTPLVQLWPRVFLHVPLVVSLAAQEL